MHHNNSQGRAHGVIVPPLSSATIMNVTKRIREICGLENKPYFPLGRFYEVLDNFFPGARFEVVANNELANDHGRTYPDSNLIYLREEVYDGACLGKGRDRFTLAHELGHLFLHRNIALARVNSNDPPLIYMNSEWQADKFASYLLMPINLVITCSSTEEMVSKFGVSYEAANVRKSEIKKATSANS